MVGPQGNPDEEMDVPPLPLLQQVYTIESTVEDGTNPQYLSGEGAVQVTSVQQQALIIEPDALVFTLAPDANLSPTHITSFRVQVTEENSPMIPDLGESPHQVPRMLRARLFSNEFPGRTHLTAYISPGDIVQMAVEDDAHEKLTETLETAGKRYITPDPPRSGQTFHPCRVTETGPNNVVVQPFGTEETQTFDRVMLINWLMDGDLLPAPRSEQSFSEPALHRV
jgi:hypothetical protein